MRCLFKQSNVQNHTIFSKIVPRRCERLAVMNHQDCVLVGGKECSFEEAKAVILGYCFADDTRWVPKWAYRLYDCSPSDPSAPMSAADVLITGALEAFVRKSQLIGLYKRFAVMDECLYKVRLG